MNLNALRTFLTIVETGSLVRASERLNVTQSTVTARLRVLEDELGQTLIHRQKSGATLTAAGQRLQRYAETISDLWQQARQEASLPDAMKGSFHLVCHPDLWPHLGAALFDYVRDSQPDIAPSIWTGGQHDLAQWMQAGRADIALSYWPTTRAGETIKRIGQDQLTLYGTTPDRPIRFDPGYVYVEGGEGFGRDHALAYVDADTARLSFGTADLARAHLMAHGGSAYLPARLAQDDLAAGRLFALHDAPVFRRDIFLITRTTAQAGWDWLDGAINAIAKPL